MRYGLDEQSLKASRENLAVARGNLYNQGLKLPGCDAAFAAALFAGGGPHVAFEAARRHALVMLPPSTEDAFKDGRGQRMYPRYEIDAAIKSRQESINTIRNLPNPFDPEVR